jgi:hypothetical protein
VTAKELDMVRDASVCAEGLLDFIDLAFGSVRDGDDEGARDALRTFGDALGLAAALTELFRWHRDAFANVRRSDGQGPVVFASPYLGNEEEPSAHAGWARLRGLCRTYAEDPAVRPAVFLKCSGITEALVSEIRCGMTRERSALVQEGRRTEPPDGPACSEDFRSLSWGEEHYTFSIKQADCIKVLVKAWVSGAPFVSQEHVLEEVEGEDENSQSERLRLRDVFRKHPAWGTLIVQPPDGRGGMYGRTKPR